MAAWVYRDCVVTLYGRDTMADLIELRMVDFDDHADHLREVLQTRRQHQLYAKFLNCEFGLESVTFLGHLVSKEEIKVDPQNIAVLKNWPRPTTPTEIRSFLGLAGYYRKFVEGFSTLASPLTKLAQKVVKFQWSDACERSFQELKSRLITAPVLTLPKDTDGLKALNCAPETDEIVQNFRKDGSRSPEMKSDSKKSIPKHKAIKGT
ncbi:PREDICTED: uncharacterized protein LOC109221396 [Nicotiana attenuata]|uniref:uncharacterized protein LOC109221396 n=1 Tax=Nicotiana attenuata TaxID=49451 RepID=UPI000904BE5E|nr:PREDICTED: uncharacterized protein LOC109221396 [Nicotiana attenuata]